MKPSYTWMVLLVSFLVGACSGEDDETSTAEAEVNPCHAAAERYNARWSACGFDESATLHREAVDDPANQFSLPFLTALANCVEEFSCSSLREREPGTPSLHECIDNYNTASTPLCSDLVRATTEPPGESDEDDGEDRPVRPSDPACKSGRSVCDYFIAQERKLCSDCRSQCSTTFGTSCDVSRSCSGSCYRVDCDDSQRDRCSDALEGL